jgi:hypothetical protein
MINKRRPYTRGVLIKRVKVRDLHRTLSLDILAIIATRYCHYGDDLDNLATLEITDVQVVADFLMCRGKKNLSKPQTVTNR